jgi:thioredoxin-related protein
MKKIFFAVLIFVPSFFLSGQSATVKWYSIEEAVNLAKNNPRPIFIDTFTEWCGWCKKFDKEVFSDSTIAGILNEKYYAVKFDAESKAPVVFQSKDYINDGKLGKFHQLAYAILKGKMSFPTVVFLNSKSELITPLPGFRPAKDFEPYLMYFSGDIWQTQSFEDFLKTFTGKVK